MATPKLDSAQAASAAQFDKQSDRYGKSHILADTSDVISTLGALAPTPGDKALDIATGGGHTAVTLAGLGWTVTAGDVSGRMLENAKRLATDAGYTITTNLFPAEAIPYPSASFDLVSSRVAPHHFTSPADFVKEATRVLKPGGYFLLIDGSVPDNDPATESWLHKLEKWRDPSHGRFLSRTAWEDLVKQNGLQILTSSLHTKKQPDLDWYFDTAATSLENRQLVVDAIDSVPPAVKTALKLGRENGKTVWWWPMLRLLARKPLKAS